MENLQKQIDELKAELNSFKNNTTIPFDVGQAFKARLLPDGFARAVQVAGTPSTVIINESGSSIVTAAAPLTGFLSFTANEITYIVPYY